MAKFRELVKWSFLFDNTESAMLMRIEFLVVAIAVIFLLMSFLDMFRRQSRHSSIKYLLLVLDAISDSTFIYTIGLMQNAPFKKDLFSVWALILVNLRFNACFISAYGIPDQENIRLTESGKVVALLGVAFLIGTQNSEFKHPIWVLWAMQQLRNVYLISAYNSATGSFLHGLSSPLVTAYMGTQDGICKNGDTTTMLAYKYLVSGDHIQRVELKPPVYKFHLEVTRRRKRHLITLDKIWLPIDQGSHIKGSAQENGDIGGRGGSQENGGVSGRGSAQENAVIGIEGSIDENAGIGGRGNAEENAGIAGSVSDQENVGIVVRDSAEENAVINGGENAQENAGIHGGTAQENASIDSDGSAQENVGIGSVQENTGVGGRGSAQENTGINGRDSAQEIADIAGADITQENADINGGDNTRENADNTQGNGDIRTPWMKDMCLSFALYRLLRCRFDDLTLPADSIPHTRRLIYDVIGKKENDTYLAEEIDKHSERAFRIVKLELAFLNDYFYTRYPILFWHGFPISVAWHPLLTIALIAWLGRDIHKLYKPKEGETAHIIHGFNVDIIITWAFMGIIVLKESWKVVTYLLSDWTKVMLLCEYTSAQSLRVKYIPQWLWEFLIKILCTPRCTIVHRWHNKIGQYDFLQSFGYSPWNILHYSSLGLLPKDIKGAKVQDPTKLPKDVKTAVVKSLCLLKLGQNSLELSLPADDSQFAWTFRLKTWSHSILVWHIATSICEIELAQHYNASLTISEVLCAIKTALNCFSSQPYVIKEERIEGALRANYIAAISISRYCAYLLVKEPDLLPDSYLTADEIFQYTLDDATDILKGCDTLQSIYRTLIREGEPEQGHQDGDNMEGWKDHPNMILVKAAKLAWSLIHEFSDEKVRWKIIAEVWADILVHTAPSWNSAAHKKCLATGGEFITHIWVILSHCDVRSSKRWPSQTSSQDDEETAAPEELGGENHAPAQQELPAGEDQLVPQEAAKDDATVSSADALPQQGHPAANDENKWTRPPADFLKLNVGADFSVETGSGAFGVILRDSAGKFVASYSRFKPHALDVPSIEAEALLEGLKLAQTVGCKKIIAESGSEEVVNAIANPLSYRGSGAAIISDCLAQKKKFGRAKVVQCPQEANAAAYELVRYSFTQRLTEIWKGQPPGFLIDTIADEIRSSKHRPSKKSPQAAEETAAPEGLGGENHAPVHQEPPAGGDNPVPHEAEKDDARVLSTDAMQEQGHAAANDENKWTRPAAGFLKLNVGASFNAAAGSGAFGVILRDSAGVLVAACSRFIPHVVDVPSMEAEALLEGLKLAETIGCKSITAESDSEGLVYAIANPSYLTQLAPRAAIFFCDCLAHLARFSSATVVNCPREANAAAYELVRYSFTKRLGEIWKDQPPGFLIDTLADDQGHPAAGISNPVPLQHSTAHNQQFDRLADA